MSARKSKHDCGYQCATHHGCYHKRGQPLVRGEPPCSEGCGKTHGCYARHGEPLRPRRVPDVHGEFTKRRNPSRPIRDWKAESLGGGVTGWVFLERGLELIAQSWDTPHTAPRARKAVNLYLMRAPSNEPIATKIGIPWTEFSADPAHAWLTRLANPRHRIPGRGNPARIPRPTLGSWIATNRGYIRVVAATRAGPNAWRVKGQDGRWHVIRWSACQTCHDAPGHVPCPDCERTSVPKHVR